MSYTPAIAFFWVGPNWSRTLFVPITVTHTMFRVHRGYNPWFEDLKHLVTFFTDRDDPDNVLDETFDDIGKMPGCVEDYIEFDIGNMPNIPPGLAIVQWHYRVA